MNRPLVWLAWAAALAAIGLTLLGPRSSYQPGALLLAHRQLSSDCAACHRAWHGPSSDGCVNCHGDFSDSNPHNGGDITHEEGLIAGRRLAMSTLLHSLECLSCHHEHRGAQVDVKASATFACTWCHKHPAIGKVPEHLTPAMQRQYFARHLFNRPFNHYQHEQLLSSHSGGNPGAVKAAASARGRCTSCHLVQPAAIGERERMSLKWSGCAGGGCHLVPQDRFMRMPASIGRSPVLIGYLGVIPVRHIKAVFAHSSGHLQSPCEQCHFKMTGSRGPDDNASLAIEQCFSCHTHRAPDAASQAIQADNLRAGSPARPASATRRVVACGDCHLFHANGVVPILDFPTPAPKFPPNQRRRFQFTVYLPHGERRPGDVQRGPLSFGPVVFSPWWLGLVGIGFVAYGFSKYVWKLPGKPPPQEAVAGVAPQRSNEVPALDDTYQTSIRHLYIVGEAAGTASINLAMRSGRQVIEAIVNELHYASAVRPDVYDVVIVGCGPAGLGATATAKVAGLNYATLEKLTPASTLRSYPRAKFVQATPIDIAEYGTFFLEGDNSREELINEWGKIIAKLGLIITAREEVIDVAREQDNLVVKTARGNVYPARCVVLAIGMRGNPRRLNLPGETPERVFYNLIEPSEFSGRRILVVGGGNAGAETAQALAAAPLANTVSYSFRSAALANVTRGNAEAIAELQQTGSITVYPATALRQIRPHSVILEPAQPTRQANIEAGAAGPVELDNDVIFAMIGAELPTAFLKAIGVKLVSKGRLYG